MSHRDADLADLPAGELMVRVVAGLGRQIEGDRQAGLALGEVAPVELVGFRGRGMARIGARFTSAMSALAPIPVISRAAF